MTAICCLLDIKIAHLTRQTTMPRSLRTAKAGQNFFSGFETHPTMWIKENAAFRRKLAEATGQRTHPILDKMGVLWYYKLVST